MAGLLLDREERLRFVDYCRREAESLAGMHDQILKLPRMEAVAKAYNARRMAYTIVADDLDKVEDASWARLGGVSDDLDRFVKALEQSLWKRYTLAESIGEQHDAAVLLAILNALAEARKVL